MSNFSILAFSKIKPLLRRENLIRIGIILAAVVLVSLYVFSFRGTLIDDAFITFQYARSLRDYHTWGFFPNQITNTATSPLNVLLTALISCLIPNVVTAALWLAVVEALLMLGVFLLISRNLFQRDHFGVLGFIATLANPLLISTLGLETLLYLLLVVIGVYFLLVKKWKTLGFILALLTLTRPDGVLLFVLSLWFVGRRDRKEIAHKLAMAGVYGLTLLPWVIFSWVYLGSLIPDTFLLKFNQNWAGVDYFKGFLLYLYRFPIPAIASFSWTPLGLWFAARGRFRPYPAARLLFYFGIFYFAAYALLKVPPYHWYYTPVAVCLNLAGVFGLVSFAYKSQSNSRFAKNAVWIFILLISCFGIGAYFLKSGGFSPAEAPLHSNWASQSQYREIGLWLKENLDPFARIKLEGEIGTLAFYSERRVIDMFSCRYEQLERVNALKNRNGIVQVLARINFRWFDPGEPCGPFEYRLSFYPNHDRQTHETDVFIKSWEIETAWIPVGQAVLWQRPPE